MKTEEMGAGHLALNQIVESKMLILSQNKNVKSSLFLSNVVQTTLDPTDFHCMKKKANFVFHKTKTVIL